MKVDGCALRIVQCAFTYDLQKKPIVRVGMQSRMVYFEFSLLIKAFLCIVFLSKSKGKRSINLKKTFSDFFFNQKFYWQFYHYFLFRHTCNKLSTRWKIYSHYLYEPFHFKFRTRWRTRWFFFMFEIFFVLFERIWDPTTHNVFLLLWNRKFGGYFNWIYQTNRLGTSAIHVS